MAAVRMERPCTHTRRSAPVRPWPEHAWYVSPAISTASAEPVTMAWPNLELRHRASNGENVAFAAVKAGALVLAWLREKVL